MAGLAWFDFIRRVWNTATDAVRVEQTGTPPLASGAATEATLGDIESLIASGLTITSITGEVDLSSAGASRSITASSQTLSVTPAAYVGTVAITIDGTYAGVNIAFEATIDGAVWFAVQARRSDSATIETTSGALTNTNRMWLVSCAGVDQFRLRSTAYTSGTAFVNIRALQGGSHPVVTEGNSSAIATSLDTIDDAIKTDDAAFTPGTTKVMMAGFQADETSTDSVDEGDAGTPRMTLDRKLIVTVQPHTSGGWDTFLATSSDGATALTNSAQAIKASAGKFGGYYIYNPNTAATYVHIYNVASGSVTVGTTNPKLTFVIPAGSAANLELVNGATFDTAMSCAATTTGGGNTAPTTALEANFYFK